MGKQGRRKQRQKRKQQHQQQQPQVAQNDVNPASAITQLRHPEPKTRHSALIAMQTTILHPGQTKKINLNVLQAIREQVMDSHLDCASTAAECLAQYLFLSSASNDDDVQYKEATAGWALILIRRLDQCHKTILQLQQKEAEKKKKKQQDSSSSASSGGAGNQKPWYALAAPCFRALCKLVEGNELALEQVHNQIQTFLSTIFGLLQTSLISLEQATSVAPVDDRFVDWIRETTIFASRTLHSALDENETLACRIEKEMMVGLLPNEKNNNSNEPLQSKLPELTQLHIIGSIVTLYQTEPTKWQSIIFPSVVDILTQKFLIVDTSQLQNLENNYKEGKQLWQSQKEDDEMEQEIIEKVQSRREPARLIARRQKTTQRPSSSGLAASQQPGEEEGEDDTAMVEDGEQQAEEEQPDGRQAMEDALIAWNHGVILPMQVALEVTANLLSCLIQSEDAMAIENDDRAAGIDQTLRDRLVSAKLPERCFQMLQAICVYQQQQQDADVGGGGDNPNSDESSSSSSALTPDLDDCISKISGCLVNCVLGQVVTSTQVLSSWQMLRRYANKNGVCSVMVVMTQQYPKLRDQLSQDVELFAGLLQIQDGTIQRDTVCLLTAAISPSSQEAGSLPPPSAEVVSKVTTELLRLLKDGLTVGVKCEVLNGFMDLYGEDDYHPHVFDNLKVLAAIQQSLDSLSSQTKKTSKQGGSSVLDPEDEEILMNVNRFVDYKLGR